MTLTPDDPRHGTSNGYTNLGCRCDACKRAHADRQQLRNAGIRKKAGIKPCTVKGCPEYQYAKGMCRRHYELHRRTGRTEPLQKQQRRQRWALSWMPDRDDIDDQNDDAPATGGEQDDLAPVLATLFKDVILSQRFQLQQKIDALKAEIRALPKVRT